jgi:hypothetical protein
MKLNVKRLDTLMEVIDAHRLKPCSGLQQTPEDGFVWDQQYWHELTECVTACCAAGFECELSGVTWASDIDWSAILNPHLTSEMLLANKADIRYAEKTLQAYNLNTRDTPMTDGSVESRVYTTARLRAQRLLGLTEEQSCDFFSGSNTWADLEKLAKKFKAQAARDAATVGG